MSHLATDILMEVKAGGGGVIPTTWNPDDKSTDITLLDANLTARRTSISAGTFAACRSISGSSIGKWYWEIKVSSGPAAYGIAANTVALNTLIPNIGAVYRTTGAFYLGLNLVLGGLPVVPSFVTLRFALDMPGHKIWLGSEYGWWNSGDPANGLNPINSNIQPGNYYAWQSQNYLNRQCTADFGQAPAYPVPNGFTSVGDDL